MIIPEKCNSEGRKRAKAAACHKNLKTVKLWHATVRKALRMDRIQEH